MAGRGMGAGESEAYLIVAGQEWVTCSDRLLDKDTRIEVIRRRARPN